MQPILLPRGGPLALCFRRELVHTRLSRCKFRVACLGRWPRSAKVGVVCLNYGVTLATVKSHWCAVGVYCTMQLDSHVTSWSHADLDQW